MCEKSERCEEQEGVTETETAADLSEPLLSQAIRRQDGCHLSTMKDPLHPKACLLLGPGGDFQRTWPKEEAKP